MITVEQTSHSDPLEFDVAINEAGSKTRYHVTMSVADHDRLTNGSCSPERCIEAAFYFLLDRERKEAILSHFDVSVISHYFPEFEAKLPQYIESAAAGEGRS
jgi:hypothetical protein